MQPSVPCSVNSPPDSKTTSGGILLREPDADAAFAAAAAIGALTVDLDAIVANWRKLEKTAVPAECAGVVKADAYGCGARPVVRALSAAGCRTFFVATLDEARVARAAAPPPISMCWTVSFRIAATPSPRSIPSPVIGDLNELAEWDVFCRRTGWAGGAAIPTSTPA